MAAIKKKPLAKISARAHDIRLATHVVVLVA